MGEMRDAVQFYFQRNRDLLFDFFGSVAGPLSDDLRVGVGDVGLGFDGELMQRNYAPHEYDEGSTEYKERIRQSEIDGFADHLVSRPLFGDFGGELERVADEFIARLYASANLLHAVGSEAIGEHGNFSKVLIPLFAEDPILVVQSHDGTSGDDDAVG